MQKRLAGEIGEPSRQYSYTLGVQKEQEPNEKEQDEQEQESVEQEQQEPIEQEQQEPIEQEQEPIEQQQEMQLEDPIPVTATVDFATEFPPLEPADEPEAAPPPVAPSAAPPMAASVPDLGYPLEYTRRRTSSYGN